MEGTYIFYTLFLLFMVLCSSSKSYVVDPLMPFTDRGMPDIRWSGNIYFIVAFYALIIGCRYLVGVDYATYLGWYKEVLYTHRFPSQEDKEFGYVALNLILAYFGAHYSFLFVIIAFLQIYFLYSIFKHIPIISRWYIFFFFTSLLMFSSMNIMRQTLAYFIFFNTILAVNDKNYKKGLFLLILGFSFHKSILLGALFIPILKYDWFKRRDVQYILLTVFFLFSYFFLNLILSGITPLTNLLGYNYYVDNMDSMYELTADNAVGAGFGIYLFLMIDAVIIYFSDDLKKTFEKYHFSKFYNLYFLGVLLDFLFRDNFVLSRTNDYLLNFRVLILSFLAVYLWRVRLKYSLNYILLFFIVVLMLAYFYRAIDNSAAKCSPIRFVF